MQLRGALTRPSARFDLVRCGIALYGLSPVPEVSTSAELGLVPAMTVQGRFAVVKEVRAGSGVSLRAQLRDRARHHARRGPGRVRRRGAPARLLRAEVLAAGRRRTIAGRVCMDQFVLDLGDSDAQAGDPVVLFGPGDAGEPTAQDWAEACGTISYEIVTRIGGRMQRRYVGKPDSPRPPPASSARTGRAA